MKTRLQVPSELKFLSIVENWLLNCVELELGEYVDWPRQSNRLRLVLVEAYSNVVRHAHREQPHLPVLICLEVKEQNIIVEIWDHGEGFDITTYLPPNPSDKQDRGYGWLIMHRLMDRVEYRMQANGSNCLKLETYLPKKDEEIAQ
ncbi:MAG: anti-sigma regulatory factor [Symploca sp. SIO1B1]|nr:anti-sigma regulatory factor [Symploca sp. SIO2D2]NER23101.1 anti-sigma regulatory factor [Symploca sp. SIO1C2]NER46371.1 anti-sigma regulatory factor [Symploca sp. SIO1A3]NER94248.1 anti-sigma regulatory factor [Symploca sp. SIO1B1]